MATVPPSRPVSVPGDPANATRAGTSRLSEVAAPIEARFPARSVEPDAAIERPAEDGHLQGVERGGAAANLTLRRQVGECNAESVPLSGADIDVEMERR